MFRILKAILFLAVLGLAGLTGYAYLGNFAPNQGDVVQPVELHVTS